MCRFNCKVGDKCERILSNSRMSEVAELPVEIDAAPIYQQMQKIAETKKEFEEKILLVKKQNMDFEMPVELSDSRMSEVAPHLFDLYGLSTALVELAEASALSLLVEEEQLPICTEVQGACKTRPRPNVCCKRRTIHCVYT